MTSLSVCIPRTAQPRFSRWAFLFILGSALEYIRQTFFWIKQIGLDLFGPEK